MAAHQLTLSKSCPANFSVYWSSVRASNDRRNFMKHRSAVLRISRCERGKPECSEEALKTMIGAIGTVIFIIVALIVIAAAGMIALSVLGVVGSLIGVAIKLAIIGGIIYLVWLVVRKLASTA